MIANGSTTFEINAEWTRFLAAYPNLSLGLLKSAPTTRDGDGALEISDSAYLRRSVAGLTFWEITPSGVMRLKQTIVFPALAQTQTIIGWALFSELSGGQMLKFYTSIAAIYNAGGVPSFAANDILLSRNCG